MKGTRKELPTPSRATVFFQPSTYETVGEFDRNGTCTSTEATDTTYVYFLSNLNMRR